MSIGIGELLAITEDTEPERMAADLDGEISGGITGHGALPEGRRPRTDDDAGKEARRATAQVTRNARRAGPDRRV